MLNTQNASQKVWFVDLGPTTDYIALPKIVPGVFVDQSSVEYSMHLSFL